MKPHRCRECSLFRCDKPGEVCPECQAHMIVAKGGGGAMITGSVTPTHSWVPIPIPPEQAEWFGRRAQFVGTLSLQNSRKGLTWWSEVYIEFLRIAKDKTI